MTQRNELDRIREVGAISEALAHRNENRRQDIARAGFDDVFGLGGRLSALVRCEVCGLLDDQSPCGDHE